ncbi:hypothetical protein B0H10DRAFT_1969617 [Mycena sp. CBHHK59/15]|nr:hypothetical protein B0H10DRAFT_1969617 [Mycena sp. CBHHK59/15]
MSKNGFRLVITMHPQIAMLIHQVLSLVIDFILKQVEGKMDEWRWLELWSDSRSIGSGSTFRHFLINYAPGYTLASLYCDTKTQVAFAQLFTKFFDAVSHVTRERFKLAPFYPDATCWAVILDGEVPQAQGFGNFLTTYNNPEISQIQTSDPLELLPNSLKTCCLHFEQHIEELPQNIPKYVIAHLKSILGSKPRKKSTTGTHSALLRRTHNQIQDLYATNSPIPGFSPRPISSSQNLLRELDITPNHSNYIEKRDNIKAQELVLMEHDGVTPNRWNGSAQREKLSGQHQKWEAHKAAIRNSQLTSYDTLKEERNSGAEENKASRERQRSLEAQMQDKMKLDWHHTDLQEQVIALWKDVKAEMSIRREWAVRRAEIDKEIQRLRDSRLAGARLKGDGARMGTMDDHLDVGLQAFESNSPVHVNDTVPELNSGHCVLGVLPPDHATEFNSRFSANMNQNVLLDDLGTVNHPNQFYHPNVKNDLPQGSV